MDKSSGVKENTINLGQKNGLVLLGKAHQGMRLFISVLALFLVFILPEQYGFLIADTGDFHVAAKDLNLLSLKSFLDTYSPGIKYDGKISLSADIKFGKGLQTVSSGVFSSDKTSFSSENFIFPLEFSQLEGQFGVNVKDSLPALSGKIQSSSVKWGKLSAQDLKADYIFEGKNLIIENGELKIAGGIVRVSGNMDFGKTPTFFNIKIITDGVNISDIAERLGYIRSISGRLFSDANLSGEIGNPTSVFGEAKINIEEGELGKVGWVGRMLTLSPLAAISKDFSLTTFEGDFSIAGGYAYTDNAELKGPDIRITAKGEAGWNKKLDFMLGLHAPSETLKGTPLTRIFGAIIDDFGNVLRMIKLTGTIDNPSFTILPLGIGGAIVEGLERTFEKGQQQENLR